ncbi:eukaryotic translation initiation factor 2-alpha kinase [Angomonas deanei]|uniref:Protein kinase domain-containing protein n=1 Tax=Angomonas deanei TaxID=59799 RepID=A0A7G2CSX4_9TRYP|nr:eukaryotic translation initiation factor 2-alpha kinase [Angomonas deanei]CAD2222870.1 hypothetical protein, conserved [Angomonas deanei]|eukprot:EPY21738.1 eukaryotic translation initiation factor 2-alpha kinase [Angomonas deanei]
MVKKSASSLEFDDVKTPLEFDAFGNANLTGECGSVLYCAPEQEKGLKYNFKVDEFSIGMIALEMWLAILGKGFRDRFNIMSEVWRSGILPEWFTQRKPKMAEIIEGLININPEKRKTCEEVLATADLPGDPIEIVQALETVEKYGDRIAGRVIQEIHNNNVKKEEWPRKPPPKLRQRVSQVAQQVFFDIVQTIHIIGQLHGTVPIAFAPQMVLPTPVNQSLGAEFVVDSGGRSSVLSNLPHLSCASFLGMQDSVPDSYYQLYHKETPFVLYTTPLPRNDGVQDHYLDSLLSFYHLLTFFNFSGSVEITVSHAIWLNAVHPRQIGSRPPPEEIAKLRSRVESVEVIATEIGKISSVLSQSCKISRETQRILSEQEDALKKYCQSIFETAKLFGIPITLTLDPSFVPSESLVNRSFLTSGVLFECQIAKSPIAFACLLDNFISACCVSDVPLSAFCINVDLLELCNIGKHVKSLPRKDLVLNGIAVRRLQHSATCTASVMEASVNLWRGNIRASLCLNGESHIFNKTLKRKNMRWCLIDGKRLVNSSHNANISRNDDVSPDNICEEVRSLFSGSKIEVEFADCSQSDPIRKEAKALCDKFVSSLNRVLVFRESVREITDALVREGKEIKDTATSDKQKDKDKGNMILESFLDDHCANHTVLPLYSVKDDALAVFINYGRLKETKKAGNGKKK